MSIARLMQQAAAGGVVETDPNFANVSLLLHGDGTSGAQNNTFLDGSTNNFTITRNGNTTQGSFSPYNVSGPYDPATHGGSGYFDGTGDYLTAPNDVDFDFGSGDFTIEFWLNLNSNANIPGIIGKRTSDSVYSPFVIYVSSGKLSVVISKTGSSWAWIGAAPTSLPLNQWVHVALVRNGNSFVLYQAGVSVASNTITGALMQNTSALIIGRTAQSISPTVNLNGYIDDLRITKGVARYTAAFTPPTKAFPDQ